MATKTTILIIDRIKTDDSLVLVLIVYLITLPAITMFKKGGVVFVLIVMYLMILPLSWFSAGIYFIKIGILSPTLMMESEKNVLVHPHPRSICKIFILELE